MELGQEERPEEEKAATVALPRPRGSQHGVSQGRSGACFLNSRKLAQHGNQKTRVWCFAVT